MFNINLHPCLRRFFGVVIAQELSRGDDMDLVTRFGVILRVGYNEHLIVDIATASPDA